MSSSETDKSSASLMSEKPFLLSVNKKSLPIVLSSNCLMVSSSVIISSMYERNQGSIFVRPWIVSNVRPSLKACPKYNILSAVGVDIFSSMLVTFGISVKP